MNKISKTEVCMTVMNGNAAYLRRGDMCLMVLSKYVKDGYLVAIVDPLTKVGDEAFVAWSRKFGIGESDGHTKKEASTMAYYKYMYLVGKMCKKWDDSKYWGCHKLEEHHLNGNGGSLSDEDTAEIQNYALLLWYSMINET